MFGLNIDLTILFVVALFLTAIAIKPYIRKAKSIGLTVKDKYKKNIPDIPTAGGLVMLTATLFTLVLMQILGFNMLPVFTFYFIILSFSLYGLADDLLNFRHQSHKIWVLFILALPIATLITDTTFDLFFIKLELGILFSFILAPLYVMVITNLVNAHSGYNGLSTGLSLILLFFIGLKSYLEYGYTYLPLLVPIFGSLLVIWWYNKYPAKVLEGNVGQFFYGSAIGAFLIISNLEWFGIFIFIPHIIDFSLFIYTKATRKEFVKFGTLREDGTIVAPQPPLKIKALVAHIFRVTELQAVLIMYGLTFIFCIIGLFII